MPKTKTVKKPDHPVSEVYFPLKPRMRIGTRTAGWLMATFALIGVVAIWSSAAATKPLATVQAEAMKPNRTSIFKFYDSRAIDKVAVVMFGNSAIEASNVNLAEEAVQVSIRARGQHCLGTPQMQLKVDGRAVGMATVSSTGYQDYTIATKIPAGNHKLEVAFINDYYSWQRRCDRNLAVDQVVVKAAVIATPVPGLPPVVPPADADGDGVADSNDNCSNQPGPLSNQGCPTPPPTTGVQAKSATSFVDSIGVNTHIGYSQYPYNDIAKVKAGLQKLGIRNIRDGDYLNNPQAQAKLKTLFDAGIKATILTHVEELDQQIALIKSYPKGSVVAVESINEPDCFLAEKRADWVQATRTHQKQLWDKVQSDPSLSYIDILGTSYCKGGSYATVGDLSANFEYGNFHPYPGGTPPEASLDYNLNLTKPVSGGKPFYATETGYHNALYTPWGHLPASQRASGIYMPRLFLNNFETGVKRTLSYELVDQRPYNNFNLTFDHEGNFGLLAHDFSEKPAGTAVRRMISVLNDTNTSFKPGKLDYTIAGDTSNLKQVLLQKSNGSFYLALWRTDSIWNNQQRFDIPVVNKPLTVKLNGQARSIKVYNLNTGDAPIASSQTAEIPLNIGAEVQILEIK